MAENELTRIERTLKALANRRRLGIIRYLKRRKEARVGDIADEIKLSFKATSKHLGVLSSAGLLERDQRRLEMYYRIASELTKHARAVIDLL